MTRFSLAIGLSLAMGRPTLADRLFPRGLAMDAVLIASGAGLTAIAAQVVVPLWPVPVTGQTLSVLLVGSALGALRGALAMVVYVLLGVAGLPVFAESGAGLGVLAGPTGGYLLAFVVAAAFTGWIAQRSWDRRVIRALASFLGAAVVMFAIGVPWLAVSLGLHPQQALASGLYPLIPGDVVKIVIATAAIALAWRLVESDDRAIAEAELAP